MRRFAPVLALLALTLTACGPSSDQVAVARYLTDAEPVASDLSEAGARFETLMNVQDDTLRWTVEEKAELQDIVADMQALKVRAEAVAVPAELQDIHVLMPQAVAKMIESMQIVAGLASDPSTATEDKMNEAVAKAEEGGVLAQQYVDRLGQLLQERYPDLLEA